MDTMKLGGNIELNGFSKLDGGTMVILKKIVGNHARHLLDIGSRFEKLSLTMNVPKEVEKANDRSMYDIQGVFTEGQKEYSFESKASNLFVAVDDVMKNMETSFNSFKKDVAESRPGL